MENPLRVEFTTGLDDLVDAHVRFLRGTKWASRQRTGAIWAAPIACCLTLFVVVVVGAGVRAPRDLLALAGVAAGVGLAVGLLYRSVYDARVRGRLRGFLEEQLAGRTTWLCEVELRGDTAWSRSPGSEVAFPWSQATGIEDEDAAVALRFRDGIIVVRNRAFPTAEDRARFIQTARSSVPGQVERRSRT